MVSIWVIVGILGQFVLNLSFVISILNLERKVRELENGETHKKRN